MVTLDIRDLEKDPTRGEVYVLNTTRGKDRSNIIFSVPKTRGDGTEMVMVPTTFIPIDLTTIVPKSMLLESSHFRRAIRKRLLTLISREEAEKIMSQDGAEEEFNRINNINENNLGNVPIRYDTPENQELRDKLEQSKLEETASPSLINIIVTQAVDNPTTESEILSSVRRLGDLPIDDYRYLAKAAKSHSWKKVHKFCKEKIEAIKAEESEDEE